MLWECKEDPGKGLGGVELFCVAQRGKGSKARQGKAHGEGSEGGDWHRCDTLTRFTGDRKNMFHCSFDCFYIINAPAHANAANPLTL
jgi:hypothetical protein